jgi:serine/threonine protein kinase
MHPQNYEICSNPLGNGKNCEVYKIKEKNHPHSILIAKIYENSRRKYYEKEKRILLKISNSNDVEINDYLIHIKNINARLEISKQFKADSTLLTFDFLMHGNIQDYISLKSFGKPISEIYIKLLCYKLLLGLKKIHNNNISHNKIDIRNLMFDDNFNPIIIHFGNAIISDNHQNDFFGLGLILVGLISSKKIISYKFNKKQNNYIFRFYSTNNYFHESSCEESVFWKILESNKNVIISKEFIDFFHLLVIPDKVLNIDELFNNIWLKDIKIYHKEIEQNFREEFKNNYFFLSQSQKLVNNFNNNSNLNNIINADEMHESISSKSLIDKFI